MNTSFLMGELKGHPNENSPIQRTVSFFHRIVEDVTSTTFAPKKKVSFGRYERGSFFAATLIFRYH